MNKLKKLVKLLSSASFGSSFFFSHEDMRALARWAREVYGQDFFRGQDPQKLCYAAFVATNAAAVNASLHFFLDERINMKSRMNPKEIDDFYRHMKRVNSLHEKGIDLIDEE